MSTATRLFKVTLPNGDTEIKATRRPVTHVVGTIHPERGYRTFRWSAAPDTAVKELQRKGWHPSEIVVIPAVLDVACTTPTPAKTLPKRPTSASIRPATFGRLALELASLREAHSIITLRGGDGSDLLAAIENVQREMASRSV